LAFYRRAGVTGAELDRRAGERPFNFADMVDPMPPGFTRLVEGSRLRAAGRDWTIRIGHGHAPEHATLWSDDGIILGGDQLLPGISANIGVYPTEPEADPLNEWLQSCRAFMPHAREDQLVLPGHKLPFTGLPFRLVQMIENHESALDRLLDHLFEPRVAFGCFVPLFRREIGPAEQGLALVEAVAHLNCLLQRGLVSRSLNADGAWEWKRLG
jgi:glyoxylase-like metal-dependent hydrolase (beta-lactamase superfamily II)